MRTLFMILSWFLFIPTLALADDPWPELREIIFGDEPIAESSVVSLDVSSRAQFAANLPVAIKLHAPAGTHVTEVKLLIDRNPSPVVAEFALTPRAAQKHISTRVRINENSMIRAIARTSDGTLHMASAFVKGAGGCAEGGYPDQALAEMKVGDIMIAQDVPVKSDLLARLSSPKPATSLPGDERRPVRITVRHPNSSGMQRDPIQLHIVPANFVSDLAVAIDGTPALTMTGGISLSQNPTLAFDVDVSGEGHISVDAQDTDGRQFRGLMRGAGS